MKRTIKSSFSVLAALVVMTFATSVLPVAAVYADTNDAVATQPEAVTQTTEPEVTTYTQVPTCVTLSQQDVYANYAVDQYHAVAGIKLSSLNKQFCEGTSIVVSLNSYATQGADFEHSGTQTFIDHDQVTLSPKRPVGVLAVKKPTACFYQTDLYFGSTRYDGVDGPLPHYPDTYAPIYLIAYRAGAKDCLKQATPANVTPTYPTCDDQTAGYTIADTKGVYYTVSLNGGLSTNATSGFTKTNVGDNVVVKAHAKAGYNLTGNTSWNFSYSTPVDCDEDEPGGRGGEEPTTPTPAPVTVTTVAAPAELANTGSNSLLTVLVAVTVMTLALGASFATRKVQN